MNILAVLQAIPVIFKIAEEIKKTPKKKRRQVKEKIVASAKIHASEARSENA